jgi:single-stranded-DNA-specific exonuclease
VRADSVEALREAVCQRAREMLRSNDGCSQGQREEVIDSELALGDMTRERMQSLSGLEPFGSANSEPVLLSRDVRLAEPARVIGGNGDHLLLQVRRGETVMKALGFGMGRRSAELGMGVPIDIVYTPRWNTFRGETSLELRLRDFRVGQVVGC